jgi:hypothetical protein
VIAAEKGLRDAGEGPASRRRSSRRSSGARSKFAERRSEQPFVKNPEVTIGQLATGGEDVTTIKVVRFTIPDQR